MSETRLEVGSAIIFVDGYGKRHNALVTCVHGDEYHRQHGTIPGCNLVFVSGDPKREDGCGRQTERETSVVHKSVQPAGGMYWCWPGE